MKKFKAGHYYKDYIEEVEVERETDQCVWIKRYGDKKPCRTNKRSSYENYFDTFEEARGYLYNKAKSRLMAAQAELEEAEKRMDAIIALRKSES